MKKTILLLIWFVSFLSLSGQSVKKITILHTNDLHSHLIGFAPESEYTPLTVNDDKTVGGFARIASIIKLYRFFSYSAELSDIFLINEI